MNAGGEKYEIVSPSTLPFPESLVVKCPRCEARLEYDAHEDDRGTFGAMEDWPVCEICKIVVDVPNVAIIGRGDPYFADRRY